MGADESDGTPRPDASDDGALRAGGPAEDAQARPRSRWRDRRAGALIGVLCILLGFGIVVQIHSNSASSLNGARQEDLVSILDDLSAQQDRVRSEIADLQATQRRIADAGSGSSAAIADARQQARTLGLLAGTTAAQGPGLTVTVAQGSHRIPAAVLLDAIEELRGAGAETLEISGGTAAPIRLGASSYVTDTAKGVSVDGQAITAPYSLDAIGDPATMAAAMQIPGGVVDTVRQAGGVASLNRRTMIVVRAVRPEVAPRYAKPGS